MVNNGIIPDKIQRGKNLKKIIGFLICMFLFPGVAYVSPSIADSTSFTEEITKLNTLDNDFMRGYSHALSGRHREAIDAFTEVIDRDPYDSSAYYRRGLSYLAVNEHDLALQDFESATSGVQVDTQSMLNHKNMDSIVKGDKDPKRIISILNKAIEENPDDADTLYKRGTAYLAIGKLDNAISDLSRAIELQPQDLDYHYNRKVALQRSDASQRLLPPPAADLQHKPFFKDTAQVWHALRPYLPPGTRLTSVHRSAREQLDFIVQTAKKYGYTFQKQPSVSDASSWQDALRFVCGKGYKVAAPGKSHHAQGIAYDLSGSNLKQIEAGVRKAAADGRIILRRGSRSALLVEPHPQNCVHVEIEA